jgi:hypothetical protein
MSKTYTITCNPLPQLLTVGQHRDILRALKLTMLMLVTNPKDVKQSIK